MSRAVGFATACLSPSALFHCREVSIDFECVKGPGTTSNITANITNISSGLVYNFTFQAAVCHVFMAALRQGLVLKFFQQSLQCLFGVLLSSRDRHRSAQI